MPRLNQTVAGCHSLPGGGVVLVHLDRSRLFVFNRTAHLLWRVLRRGDLACLPFALARYGVPMDVAERDADAIIRNWIANGLLVNRAQAAETHGPPPELCRLVDSTPKQTDRFRIGSLLFELRAPHGFELVLRLLEHLRDEATEPDVHCLIELDERGLGRLSFEGETVVDGVPPQVLIGGLFQGIIERLHPGATWLAIIHGGAVARNAKAAIIAAPPGSGKSTLIAYLVAHGYEYLSDDLVPLRADGMVAPFPLPIGVKPGAAPDLAPFYPSLDATSRNDRLQLLTHDVSFLTAPQPATALIFLRYVAEARTRFVELTVEEAFTRLLGDRVFLGYPIENNRVSKFIKWLRKVDRRELIYSRFEEGEQCLSQVLTP